MKKVTDILELEGLSLSEVLALVLFEEEGLMDALALWLEFTILDVLRLPETDVLTN